MKEEVYTLTLKGLLSLTISSDQEVNNTLDSIELYLRRHYSNGGCPAIVFDENKFYFITVAKQE
jgi:hypothetical protein